MHWYKHDPNAALTGMIGLTVEERGAYYTLIDLLYARAPAGNVTDELVIKALAVDPRVWRRLKHNLIAKGKVQETANGLMANRVMYEVGQAKHRMERTREMRVQQLKKQEPKLTTNGEDQLRPYVWGKLVRPDIRSKWRRT